MDVIVVLVIWLVFLVTSILMIAAPVAIAAVSYYLFRRKGTDHNRAILFSTVPVLMLLTWPLSGLVELSGQYSRATLVQSSSEKLGPIDALLVDGPGMWWLDGKIDVERRKYGTTTEFTRREAKKTEAKCRPKYLSETELRSRYKVTVSRPQAGNFLQRYVTTASIIVEERSTGKIVASFTEPSWGGGLIGSYIGVFSALNPFQADNTHLSCGYASEAIGIFRGHSKERGALYRQADQKLVEQVFILTNNAS